MRSHLIFLVGLGMAAGRVAAQNVQQQARGAIIPAYTDQQRWNRMAFNFDGAYVAAIAHAKSLGKTAEEFGQFSGKLFAPGWGPPNSGTALSLARGTILNVAGYPNSEAQLEAAADTLAVVRYRRTYVPYFGAAGVSYGVSVAEFEKIFESAMRTIATYLGVRLADAHADGDWYVITYAGRGSAATSTFPAGTYTATYAPQAVKNWPELAGNWQIVFTPDGRFTRSQNGETVAEGRYSTYLDQFTMESPACSSSGTYRWMVNAATGALTFARLADQDTACAMRVRLMTLATHKKK